jgi:diguanylate cyclase (GGDEF)-like protein/PAS domain S-box-containing protein
MSLIDGEQADRALTDLAVMATLGETPSAQWLTALLSALPVAAAIADETLRLLAVNTAFGAMLERPAAALIGTCAGGLFVLDAWEVDLELDQLPLESGQSRSTPARAPRSDGPAAELTLTLSRLDAPTERALHLLTLQRPTASADDPFRDTGSSDAGVRIRSRPILSVADEGVPIMAVCPGAPHGTAARQQLERVAAILRRGHRSGADRTYILSVPFSLFDEREQTMAYLAACRALPTAARNRLILMLDAPPARLEPARLVGALEALRPFASQLALALPSLDELPPAPESLGLGLLALRADRLADSYRRDPQRLFALCQRLRGAGISLLGRDCASHADAEFARRVRLDYISYAADPRRLPRSRLFALAGVDGHCERVPALPDTAIIEATDSGIVYVDATHPDQPVVRVNPAFLAMTGYAEGEVLGRNCRFLQGPDTDAATIAQISAGIREGVPVRCELLNYRKDGTPFWNHLAISPVRDADGRITAFAGMLTDITAQRATQAAHDQFAQMLAGIAESVPGFVYQISQRSEDDLHFTYVGRSAAALFGLASDAALTPRELFELTLPEDRARLAESWREAARTLETLDLEFAIQRPDGERRWLRSRVRPMRRANGDILWNGVSLDVTPEKAAKDELTYLRDHDPLTCLPNARRFHDELATYLTDTRSRGRRASLFIVDFVHFHEINDTYGMSTGDQILTMIAARLQEAFPADSRFFRLQADQFAVLVAAEGGEQNARQIAGAAAPVLSAPFDLAGGMINLPARIGVCVDSSAAAQESGGEGALEFAQRADIALHAAKRAASPGITLYSTDIDDRLRTSVIVKQSLRGAIERREFELHYQPIVQIKTGRILGAEALVRWNHPLLGTQPPDTFIPIAEETGLIGPLGAWILRDALHTANLCRAAQLPQISVNVSGVQISDPGFLATVEAALAESGVDPRMLELELTETFLIGHCAETSHALAALRKLGVRIAIDDFGAGYSSFHYLRHLPVDKLKVDRSFVRHLQPEARGDVAILEAMVAMARSLGVELVVEGIETPFQRDLLASIGCEIAQGYLFARPGPLAELLHRLDAQTAATGASAAVGEAATRPSR